jgi:hypothetical protein
MRYLIFAIILMQHIFTYAQNKIDRAHFVELLQKKKYSQVFNEAMQKRSEVYGKCAIVDYFIAKSLCLDGHKPKSVEWLQYIKKNYPLKPNAKQFIDNEIRSCSNSSNAADLSLANSFTVPLPQAGVGGMMKGGMTYDCHDKRSIINFENLTLESDLESRLFNRNQANAAINNLRKLLGDEYSISANSRYIIVSQKSMNIDKAGEKEVAAQLDKAYSFFTTFYGLRAPDKLITVYLSPDNETLATTAKRVHGISVPKSLLGYSLLGDLSLSGISDPVTVGTLYHELFHLLIRTDVGDIPAWVDEGLASLYSISSWKNDALTGSENTWRIRQLQVDYLMGTNVQIPSLNNLMNYDWEEFNGGEENNLCLASVNYALSNFFILYLQEKNLLKPLVKYYKQRNGPGINNESQKSENVAIVEKLLNDNINKIERNYNDWFKKKFGFNQYLKPPEEDGQKIQQFNLQKKGL